MSIDEIRRNYRKVKDLIKDLSKDLDYQPELLVVSKFQSEENILFLHCEENQKVFGENYVQELLLKSKNLPKTIQWHFIGHLQKNKVKSLLSIENLVMIETLDSIELAQMLNKTCELFNKKNLKVMIQVKTSNEINKTGAKVLEVPRIFEYIISECKYLNFQGLMTMGDSNVEFANECFTKLIELKNKINELAFKSYPHLNIDCKLSMGTTRDLDLAIKNGSNQIRIGSAIFGERSR